MKQIHSLRWDTFRAHNNPDNPLDAIQLISDAMCVREDLRPRNTHIRRHRSGLRGEAIISHRYVDSTRQTVALPDK